jgi:perosamine synthetase
MKTSVAMLHLPSDQDSTGRTFDEAEVAAVTAALASGTLTATKGKCTKAFETRFAEMIGSRFAYACSSGSAAVHCAVAALDPEPGDEIITTAITDMGALAPILYQGAIPVFADVDPHSLNVTAETIARVLSPRTRAIIVTHLFGNPCEMAPIIALAAHHGLPIIEDSAQALLARYGDQIVGSIGSIGAFSLQQGKHITTGEGGVVVTDDEQLARRIRMFINKAWPYGEANADHEFLALNYRISELQGAVAGAQLEKLPDIVASRRAGAARFTAALAGLAGIGLPVAPAGAEHAFWKFPLHVDSALGGPQALARKLGDFGIASAPRYIQKPAFACRIFKEQNTFGSSHWPFTLARPEAVRYAAEDFAGTYDGLEHVLVLPWNERYTNENIDDLAACVRDAVAELRETEAVA